jgi:hypothetical protein
MLTIARPGDRLARIRNINGSVLLRHGLVFHHAVTQLEHAQWLTSQGRGDQAQPLLVQVRETLELLEAKPWLERLATAEAATPAEIPA